MTKTSKRNIARNSGFLYIRMIVTMIISLYTSRVILLYLGAVDFGIYGVVWSTVSLFSFFNLSMTTAFRRCLSFELGKKNERRYYQVLGTLIRYRLQGGAGLCSVSDGVLCQLPGDASFSSGPGPRTGSPLRQRWDHRPA